MRLFGIPGGRHIHPLAPENAVYNNSYAYRNAKPGSVTYTYDITSLYLVVSYDENDVVVNVYEKIHVVDN